MGSSILVWARHREPDELFDTLAHGGDMYLHPNPRIYGYTWRFYPTAGGDYTIEGTDEEIAKIFN
jgi:hypothetical protein